MKKCWVTDVLKDKHKAKLVNNYFYKHYRDNGLYHFMEFEDVRQEILTRIYATKDKWNGTCCDTSFMYTVARNLCINLHIYGTREKRDFRKRSTGPSKSFIEDKISELGEQSSCNMDSGEYWWQYFSRVDHIHEDSPEKLLMLEEDMDELEKETEEDEAEVLELLMRGADRRHLSSNMGISYAKSRIMLDKIKNKFSSGG